MLAGPCICYPQTCDSPAGVSGPITDLGDRTDHQICRQPLGSSFCQALCWVTASAGWHEEVYFFL